MMKRCIMFGVAGLLLVTLAGCPVKPGLVGNWRVVYTDGFVEFWTFHSDGTFEWSDTSGSSYGDGTYTRVDNTVTATESWDDNEGSHDVITELTLSDDELSFSGTLTELLDSVVQNTYDIDGTKR